jgi:hypothetical protein
VALALSRPSPQTPPPIASAEPARYFLSPFPKPRRGEQETFDAPEGCVLPTKPPLRSCAGRHQLQPHWR